MKLPVDSFNLANNFRGAGYILETALADLVDNSVFAESKNVKINFIWDLEDSYVEIIDDGFGMSKGELIKAMTWCAISSSKTRNTNDLGRFGLGLKTASLSQGRRLTVTSWKNSNHYTMCWDLDTMGSNWECECTDEGLETPENALKTIKESPKSGTHILWNKLDSLNTEFGTINLDEDSESDFYTGLEYTKKHLTLSFHRIIGKSFNLYLNNQKLEKIDPFFQNHNSTQIDERSIPIPNKENIKLITYLLPHKDKCSSNEYKIMNGGKGLFDTQGFYVYRNKRLISSGGWFRLIAKSEGMKYARVMIDLPNSMDAEWEIDILKKEATPPRHIRKNLRSMMPEIVEKLKKRFTYRADRKGHNISGLKETFWLRKSSGGKISYVINIENKLVMEALKESNTFKVLLPMIEKEFPFESVYNDKVSESKISSSKTPEEELDLAFLYANFLISSGIKKEQLKDIQYFKNAPETYEKIISSIKTNEHNRITE